MDPLHYFGDPDLDSYFCCGLDELPVVTALCSHPPGPETAEIILKYLFSDVSCLDSITTDNLFKNLEDYLSHLLLWSLELADQRGHDSLCVLCGMSALHERNDETDCFQEGTQRPIS